MEIALTASERLAIEEEEALLARVQAHLAEVSRPSNRGDGDARLLELRDEATSAHPDDLPALLDQLHVVRTVHQARRVQTLPARTSPYFAHFRLQSGDQRLDYLLGHVALFDLGHDIRILDWRNAPLSQLYYRYREGDAFEEELAGGLREGVIEIRRAVVVADGKLQAIATPQGRLEKRPDGWHRVDAEELPRLMGGSGSAERGELGPGLGTGAGRTGRVRVDVSSLLDPTQFEIVTAHGMDPLLILGSAGSGKTTVALHRLAALRAKYPDRFGAQRLLVVVPEPGLARLATRLLAPFGLDSVVATLADWSRREVARLMPELPRRIEGEAPTGVARLKRHRALLELLPNWLGAHAKGRKNPEKLRQEILTDRGFLRGVLDRSHGGFPPSSVEETVQRTLRQMAIPSESHYRHVDPERRLALDERSLDEGTPEEIAHTLDLEDLPLLLELWRLTHGAAVRPLAHLVLDEAQEFCAAELVALRQALGSKPSVTVAGDDVQKTNEGGDFTGWDRQLSDLGIPGAERRTLAVNYRCPLPIARFAREVLGTLGSATVTSGGRPGAPIGRHRFSDLGAETLFLQDALSDLLAREPDASVAVLTRNLAAAQIWARGLSPLSEVRLVRGGNFSFEPGIDVCEVTEAKGLEFDYVIVPDADAVSYPSDDASRRTLHVAATRAMHQLWLAWVGTPSPIALATEASGSFG